MAFELIRNLPLSNQDLNALQQSAWTHTDDTDWAPILSRSLGWVGATADGQLVGFVNVAWDGGAHAFLLATTVHADYQRQGIGRALVVEAAALARARGAVWLHVDCEEELSPFYRACGFHPTSAGLLNLTVK